MSEIDFIWPDSPPRSHPAFDKLSLALVASQPYVDKNPLSEHLRTAIWYPALDLSVRRHVNFKKAKEFDCLSYYADDPDVIAYCAAHDDVYLATIGAPFVRKLIKICNRIGRVLPRLVTPDPARPQLEQDDTLSKLIQGDAEVSDSEAQDIVSHWPAADTQNAQLALGEYAIFYDLIRLIWLHEWAHALCGHVSFVSSALHIAQLHEFSAERVGEQVVENLGYPRNDVLQALEIHADEFAVNYCVGEILWGEDPIGTIAGPQINLVERLLIFNIACCVFAVMWSLAEQRFLPGMSFYPPRQDIMSDKPDPMFVTLKTTHPPAVLRYLRFRDFQRDRTFEYAQQSDPRLSSLVDGASMLALEDLGSINRHFYELKGMTPVAATTPEMRRLEAYEAYLLKIGTKLHPWLSEMCFLPTFDPYKEDDNAEE